MAGIYRQRHPEHAVFYCVFFHYIERFLREYEDRFEKESSLLSNIEEQKPIDRIIRHLELTFEAERPPPHHVQQEFLMAAEERGVSLTLPFLMRYCYFWMSVGGKWGKL